MIGSFKTKKSLRVGEEALVKASIEAENAWVGGQIEGNLIVKNHLEISGKARIKGDIQAQILTMETGAQVNGQIKMNGEGVEFKEINTEV